MELTATLKECVRHFFIHHSEPPRPLASHNDVADSNLASSSAAASSSAGGRTIFIQEVDCMKLLDVCPEVGTALLLQTTSVMDTLRVVCADLCREAGQSSIVSHSISLRLTHVPAAMTGLPSVPPSGGQLVQLCGSIIRMSTKRVVPYASRIMCPRCRETTEVFTNPFDRATEAKAHCTQPACKHEPMQVIGQVWMDYAECRLQQRSNQSGRLPRSVLVTLDDELSMKCSVGQFVEVVGLAFPKWRHVFPSSRPAIEPAIWAVNVQPMEAYRGAAAGVAGGAAGLRRRAGKTDRPKFSPEHFFVSFCKNKRQRGVTLVRSVCPHLSGLFAPRLAVLLSALGGASTTGKTAMHIRSTIHCLFVGDPSTGKTQLLRFAAAIAPRSTSTTGMGSTSAGLTVAAAKEHGEWVLEPGALVLSDGGSCIIDELRTVSPADRASLHEAMEQQTISVAKGGLVTKLRTNCAVLSACNPPTRRGGRTEIGVGGPLLSRFDFIFLLWDTPQPEVDARIASHMLRANTGAQTVLEEKELTTEEVARYLWWIRTQYAAADGPLLSDPAADLLGRYYEIQRQRGATPSLDDAVPVTVRFLESLVRLAQAHAKLHLQTICTLEDAAMAVFLMERTAYSLKCPLDAVQDGLYSSSRELDEVFLSDTPDALAQQEAVLAAIVDVMFHYRLPATASGDAYDGYEDSNSNSSRGERDVALADLPFMQAMRATDATSPSPVHPPHLTPVARGDPALSSQEGEWLKEDGTLLAQRNGPSALLQAKTLAIISSAARLADEVGRTSCTAYSVARYGASGNGAADSSPGAVAAVLSSQRASRRLRSSPRKSAPPMSQQRLHGANSATQKEAVEGWQRDVVEEAEEELLMPDSEHNSATSSASPSQALPPPSLPSAPLRTAGSFAVPSRPLSMPPNGTRKRTAEDVMRSLRYRR
ncbi:putative DNA replication licensing factor MCM9 [Leptomonas pyrrhocoris]|uniref:Putative DNA replication licensing factor MCM9 n=1 Tax=Leptomonas pyrrhocoris TaxID=157538 RepID=A0A0N0E0M3_LEPPY|nr:putative DNA replication licensing factor MCM9 [Leptomonas pyrrhocoris]XP_015665054.1 putative DNA replication licensing factor MCM9 [Leptomonas pyrrhocoris]XP_015665055.1 putative DNA replication licensing factor MCM9 [Leptomonas pyrrhocoris]KPA86614.1 putative DNA replication licensing factor MCM9 [Leptomonas pyrrhocoris]KPA86615.1 putative DNA replication licensing factor MCM9 [Leptomonas pyrrhocoris]KPA86616.1 putative DNA replication licensing factor MCM9 [Leptomonas pyrrhocoris]|eukprot:XP_015665053.1 putative DNA replication licensing factor MCM9 [Leptomonas pyrrhocoris]